MEDEAIIKVLLVEDDKRLSELTARYLTSHGLLVTCSDRGSEAISEAGRRQFDVVLLDLNLPGIDGIEVCRNLRQKTSVPIIMVTARTEEVDRVLGLDAGADDYVSKPFSPRELLSRVKAAVRRARGQVGPANKVTRVGTLMLDAASLKVMLGSEEVPMTSYEFALLHALARNAGRVLSREQLLDLAGGGAEEAFDRSIDVHISRLRQKLKDDAKRPRLLKTVRGAGYMLTVLEEA